MIDGKWWDSADILSYNCQGNIVKAKREIGKSYGQLKKAIARRERNHEAMIWLRFSDVEADALAGCFGDGKWVEIWESLGMTADQFRRKGRRVLWRKDKNSPWLPLIRFAGLTEWHNLRDNDDPQEKFLFFDEFIVPDSKLRNYRGRRPADDFIDLWISLRRGKAKMPFLMCGNPELGSDWFLPSIGIDDREKMEKISIYTPRDDIRDKCRSELHNLDRVAVQWTQNPDGHSAGGSASGLAQAIPQGLQDRVKGTETLYAIIDLGDGPVTLWLSPRGVLVDVGTVAGKIVFRDVPDGSLYTRILPRDPRRLFGLLKSFWLLGRVYYTGAEAFRRFSRYVKKLV